MAGLSERYEPRRVVEVEGDIEARDGAPSIAGSTDAHDRRQSYDGSWVAPSTWRSRSRRADVTARVHAPAAGLARSRGAFAGAPVPSPHPSGPSRARRAAGGDGAGRHQLRSATAFYRARPRAAAGRCRRTAGRARATSTA